MRFAQTGLGGHARAVRRFQHVGSADVGTFRRLDAQHARRVDGSFNPPASLQGACERRVGRGREDPRAQLKGPTKSAPSHAISANGDGRTSWPDHLGRLNVLAFRRAGIWTSRCAVAMVFRMPIITLAGQKGGVGKTTIALSLAAEWHARGRRVLVVDADGQGTAITWAEVAQERKKSVPLVVSMGDNIRDQLSALAEAYDVTIVDCPGRAGKRQAWALAMSDLAILPCGATGPEIWALAESVDLVRDVQALQPELRAVVAVTRKSTGTVLGRDARRALADTGFNVLNTELAYRIGYGEAITGGMGPTTYQPRSEAAKEIKKLVNELEQILGMEVADAAE